MCIQVTSTLSGVYLIQRYIFYLWFLIFRSSLSHRSLRHSALEVTEAKAIILENEVNRGRPGNQHPGILVSVGNSRSPAHAHFQSAYHLYALPTWATRFLPLVSHMLRPIRGKRQAPAFVSSYACALVLAITGGTPLSSPKLCQELKGLSFVSRLVNAKSVRARRPAATPTERAVQEGARRAQAQSKAPPSPGTHCAATGLTSSCARGPAGSVSPFPPSAYFTSKREPDRGQSRPLPSAGRGLRPLASRP